MLLHQNFILAIIVLVVRIYKIFYPMKFIPTLNVISFFKLQKNCWNVNDSIYISYTIAGDEWQYCND